MELGAISLELTVDPSGLNFEAFYLSHLLKKSAITSIKAWLEHDNREVLIEDELERLESAWTICLDFFINRLDPVVQSALRNDVQYRSVVLPTKYQHPLSINVSPRIVLLVLQPALDPFKPIRCNRYQSSIEQQPRPVYDVLSYAWGDPQETKRILLNGTPFEIQKSLESALRYLRLPNEPRVLWVDSLCVVGQDAQGWSHDVERLTPIYANARDVLVWLGNESNTSGLALSFLEEFARLPEAQKGRLIRLLCQDKALLKPLNAILNLMYRPWWDRARLLQELIRGCKIMFWCGTRSVSWDVFSQFFQALHEQKLNTCPQHAPYRASQISHLIPIGSVGYFPSLQRSARGELLPGTGLLRAELPSIGLPGIGLPGIIEALSFGLERTFRGSNLPTAWALALTRIAANFGSFMTYIALRLCRDDVENRQACISKALGAHQVDTQIDLKDGLPSNTRRRNHSDNITQLINALPTMDSGVRSSLAFEESWRKTGIDAYTTSSTGQVGLREAFDCWMAVLNAFGANGTTDEPKSFHGQTAFRLAGQPEAKIKMPTLIYLCPSDNPGSEIICNSFPVDIAALLALGVEHGPHCALSHLWEDGASMDTICLDGKETQVLSTLATVLRSLRRVDLPILLWTDVDGVDGPHKQAHDSATARFMYSSSGHMFICGDERDASHFPLSTIDAGLTSQLIQLFECRTIREFPISLPVILPSFKPGHYVPDVGRYSYQVLPTATSIRLLEVLPLTRAETREDMYSLIQCSMTVVDLEDSPDYDAFSYTWGNPLGVHSASHDHVPQSEWYTPNFEIECNGRLISISANLFAALISIRWMLSVKDQPMFKNRMEDMIPSQHLWIDAVCINQADVDERSQQVAFMNRIYRQAATVYVWLGGEDDLMKAAIQTICILTEKRLQGNNVFDRIRPSGMNILYENTYRVLGLPRIPLRDWIALYAFLSRSWFTRAWIVQEVCLAKKITLLCGLQAMTFSVLLLAVEVLFRSGWEHQLMKIGEAALLGKDGPMAIASTVCGLHRAQPSSGLDLVIFMNILDVRASFAMDSDTGLYKRSLNAQPNQLVTNIAQFRNARAMDPRDKIYSLMNISHEFIGDPSTNESTVTPNYRLSSREVFIQSSTFMLLSSQHLELLSLVRDREATGVQGLPSWVPDFTAGGPYLPLEFGIPSPYTAADGLGPVYRAFPSPEILEVQGIYVGTLVCANKFDLLHTEDLLSKLADVISQVPPMSAIARPRLTERLQEFILHRQIEGDDCTALLQAVASDCTIEYQSPFDVLWRAMLADKSHGDQFQSSQGSHPLPVDFGVAMRVLFREIINELQVKARDELIKGSSDAVEHLENLSREYTAFQQLLSEEPDDEPLSLPPEFQEFLHISATPNAFSLESAKQQHTRMLKRSRDAANENFMEEIRQKDFGVNLKSLFRTNLGQIGRGAMGNMAGDEVWVLAGGNVPFTLRKVSEGRYTLIGECYVHGIMHGEAVANAIGTRKTIHIV
ncbi:hypothetical protein EKO27_g8045 [Xylaria grammica]|uniref:Heterokaryon incompatibility domain-containing protein n=1 Tax=Xylaria grammica TaxID=363999 RepID=A0A439CXW7_9PEZI|nr:hypothetical protein EKO27_g8045 [Xylaria grammica]